MAEVTGTRSRIVVYDRGMPVSVNLQTVHPRKLAAVRREVAPGAVGSAWGRALNEKTLQGVAELADQQSFEV